MNLVFGILLCVPIIASLLPLLRCSHWTVRVFDFPRLQIAFVSLLLIIASVIITNEPMWMLALQIINALCLLYQLYKISAYGPWHRKQVLDAQGPDDERTLSILNSNVLTPNRDYQKVLDMVARYQPDLFLTLETDAWWEDKLQPLEQHYPYTVKIPLDNLYGMHLYSRLELSDTEVRYWVKEDIPSIVSKVILRSGEQIKIYCLHPEPPAPGESDVSTPRDAELLLAGKEIDHTDETVIVFGDMNDVAWSHTTRLFQKISGLLDPRVGRGLFNTFHAHHWFLRWPLDHMFVSNDFLVKKLLRLGNVGSDHFPVYAKFQYHPKAEALQPELKADVEDHQDANATIAEAEPIKEVVDTKYD